MGAKNTKHKNTFEDAINTFLEKNNINGKNLLFIYNGSSLSSKFKTKLGNESQQNMILIKVLEI